MHRSAKIVVRSLVTFVILILIAGSVIYLNRGPIAAFAAEAYIERQGAAMGLSKNDQQSLSGLLNNSLLALPQVK